MEETLDRNHGHESIHCRMMNCWDTQDKVGRAHVMSHVQVSNDHNHHIHGHTNRHCMTDEDDDDDVADKLNVHKSPL